MRTVSLKMQLLIMQIELVDVTLAISEKDFILRDLNNLPKEYDVIIDSLDNQLGETRYNTTTLEVI